ncbi:hypothetical protein FMUND_11937 [Fusarium mundagurra]|uniref:Heterokaryon incompatibility domain-containing protein n=1 Tax=Fusarium mundagurra TaxID=1567541 RepID=A0A8H5Y587_9HYPO|nr:hypothetical protein FMUND_11937 [Fusarium mundagurra]
MATSSATKAGSVRSAPPGLDIFKTPENTMFYSANLYQSLDKSKQEIRLIEISTQTGDDGILECKLLPATLLTDARKQYLALSYCAGDPTDTKEILVNGVRCKIFANLHHALVLARQYWIRSSGEGQLRLWVDQLCINQHDLSERSHQVGFMREIYQSAERTLACLSTPTTSGEGLKWFNDLCDAVTFQEDHRPSQYDRKAELGTEERDEIEGIARESDGLSDTNDDGHENLRQTRIYVGDYLWDNMHVESLWWNRAWICQEFLVSSQVTFMFGNHFVSWEQCWRTMRVFCGIRKDVLVRKKRFLKTLNKSGGHPEYRQLCHILDIFNQRDFNHQVRHVSMALRMKIRWSGTMDIKALLSHSRSCKSSDDRDRVYAMLGLASPGYQIFPDYSQDMTAAQVMIMTTKAIIDKEDSLNILMKAATLVQSRNLDVPSWVVDWSSTEALDIETCF